MEIADKEMKHISVLIVLANEPLPRQGGMERVTDSLARALVERGVRVTLLCRNKNRLGVEYNPPCELFFVPKNGDKRQFIRALLKDHEVTHIVDQGEGELIGKYGYFDSREDSFENINLIALLHSSPRAILTNYKASMGRRYSNCIKRWLYNNVMLKLRKQHSLIEVRRSHANLNRNYDKVVLLSPTFIPDFIHYCPGIRKEKLLAIPNMNSFETVNSASKQRRVLFVGRLMSNVKGCDKLLRIWKMASDGMTDWRLDIVGDGPDRKSLELQARKLGLSNVEFHGFKDPQEYYERSQIFCMTSVFEGFGVVLTEAMQHGCVPMAFDSYSSVHDIINDGVDGVLIPKFKEKRYVEELRKLMTDEQKRASMSNAARESVEKFSKEKVTDQWIKLFKQTQIEK